jgi:hypothetical protein
MHPEFAMSSLIRRRALTLLVAVLAAGPAFAADIAISQPAAIGSQDGKLDPSAIERAALASLLSTAETLSGGSAVQVEIVDLRAVPASSTTLSMDGVGRMRVGTGGWIPMRFNAGYDSHSGEVFGLRVNPLAGAVRTAGTQADPATSERVSGQVAARILAEFPDQPTEISFVDLRPIADGDAHLAFRGTGLVDFHGEGVAPVDFSAIVDRDSGLVVAMDYELRLATGHGEASTDAVAAN